MTTLHETKDTRSTAFISELHGKGTGAELFHYLTQWWSLLMARQVLQCRFPHLKPSSFHAHNYFLLTQKRVTNWAVGLV
jgi:hypothetical protein